MTMYLSVTPHIEPTHTHWTADPRDGGQKERPRYGAWKSDRDGIPDTAGTIDDLVARQGAALHALAAAVRQAEMTHEAHASALAEAVRQGNDASAGAVVDAFWADLYPIFRAASALAETWNDTAFVVGQRARGDRGA
jgi:hypothetical protein